MLAQTRIIDSLKQRVYRATDKTIRLKALLDLCEEYKSLDRDTLDVYAKEAKLLASNESNIEYKGLAELATANTYFRWGWMDSALAIIEPALKRYPVTDPTTRNVYFKLARQRAMCYGGRSRFQEALAVLYQVVNDAEKYHDTIPLATNLNTIGSIALARNQPKEALKWHYKALSYATSNRNFLPVLAAVYVNMADAFGQLNKTDSADYYIEKGILLFRQLQNLTSLALALQKESAILIRTNRMLEAEDALKEMIAVRKQSTDGSMYVDDFAILMDFYIESKQVDKAIKVCQDLLVKGDYDGMNKAGSRSMVSSSNMRMVYYEMLAKCYKLKGEGKLYSETLEKLVAAKDSFYEANSAQAIAELQTKYEVQKKENTIIQQNLDLAKKNNQLFGSVSLLLLAVMISYALFVIYKRKQKNKLERALTQEKHNATRAVADAKEKERGRIAADLHDNLGVQANAILYGTELLQQQNQPKESLVNDLHDTAKDMMLTLRETLWAMKNTDATAADIWIRIVNFGKQIGRYYPSVKISTEGPAPTETEVNSIKALNIVLIVQEAVNNALRHSAATQINIKSSCTAAAWEIIVEDNGTGFEEQEANQKKESYGLENMKNRAEGAGMKLLIDSTINKGTKIILHVE